LTRPDQEKATEDLILEFEESKSLDIRDEIVERNLYLAEILARKYTGRGIEYEDLLQVASYALVLAVDRYESGRGAQFASFATPTIIGEIKKYFRDTMWSLRVPRSLKELSMRIPDAKERLQEKNGRVPTVQELAKYLEVSEEEIIEALESSRAYTTFSLDQEYENAEEETYQFDKFILDEESGYERFENSAMFEKVISGLNQTEKDIIRKRFLQEVSQREVAESLGISQMTVSRIEKAMKEKFQKEYSRIDG
jgi:RNA polymerase sigma-B factor